MSAGVGSDVHGVLACESDLRLRARERWRWRDPPFPDWSDVCHHPHRDPAGAEERGSERWATCTGSRGRLDPVPVVDLRQTVAVIALGQDIPIHHVQHDSFLSCVSFKAAMMETGTSMYRRCITALMQLS